ncbi:MAG: transposase [Janthinobacterium lividum]
MFEDGLLIDRRAMDAVCAAGARSRWHARRTKPRQPPLCGSGPLALMRNGCRWWALPAAYGNWHTTYTRFQCWTASGVWARVLAEVQQDDALHTLLVDSTTVWAHQHASGARKKKSRKPLGAAAVACVVSYMS